jgi:hypothetical protein
MRDLYRTLKIEDSAATIDSPPTVNLSTAGLAFCLNSGAFPLRRAQPSEMKNPRRKRTGYPSTKTKYFSFFWSRRRAAGH